MNNRIQNIREVLKKRQDDLSLLDFQAKYRTEDDCREYLFQIRWPNGFYCFDCGHTECYYIRTRKVYQCKQCRKQHSLLSGTIFQETHIPLMKWFWAIYLVSRDKRGISAIGLKNAINVSYPTAWSLLHKIRHAMAVKDQDYILQGLIVIDDAFFGGVVEGKKRGRGTEKTKVLVAVSLVNEKPQFAKISVIENMKKETITKTVNKMVEDGSILRSDAHKTIVNLDNYKHEVVVASKDKPLARERLRWVNTIISNAKANILGTYHGLPKKYLQRYLDEYCYRLNRRFCEKSIFENLLNACLQCEPVLAVSYL